MSIVLSIVGIYQIFFNIEKVLRKRKKRNEEKKRKENVRPCEGRQQWKLHTQ